MHSSEDIGSGLMDCSVDGIAGRADDMHVSPNDDALLVDQTQVFRCHATEAPRVRVDPEVIGENRISYRDMAPRALVVVAIRTKPAESRGMVEFAEGSFILEVVKDGDTDLP